MPGCSLCAACARRRSAICRRAVRSRRRPRCCSCWSSVSRSRFPQRSPTGSAIAACCSRPVSPVSAMSHAAAISAASLAASGKTEVPLAAIAVLIGFSTNALSKTVVAFSLGDRRFAFAAAAGPGADGAGCLGRMVREILARMTATIRPPRAPLSRRSAPSSPAPAAASAWSWRAPSGRDGWTLGLFDRNVERLAHVEEELSAPGLTVLAYPGDVTQRGRADRRGELVRRRRTTAWT